MTMYHIAKSDIKKNDALKTNIPSYNFYSSDYTGNIIKPHIETVKSFLPRVSPEHCARMLNYEL